MDISFIKHKTAGWEGVVFTGEDGKQYATNASCHIWEYTKARQEKSEPVSASAETIRAILQAWEQQTGSFTMSGMAPAGFLDELRAMLRKEG